jgi:hypothetical protein
VSFVGYNNYLLLFYEIKLFPYSNILLKLSARVDRLNIACFLWYTKHELIYMTVDTKLLVPLKEANQNFVTVVRIVDEKGEKVD